MHHINNLWLKDLVRLLKKYKVELKLKDTFMTKHQRHNDRHILNDILTHTSSILSRKKLLACRLYLKITLLSDITNIKGSFLIPNVLLGIRSSNRHHNLSWSLQKKPKSHSWELWNRTLRGIYCCTSSSLQLKKHFYLHRWLPDRYTVHQHQYSPASLEVFEYKYTTYFRFFVIEKGTSSSVTIPDTIESCDVIPTDAYPIQICPDNSFKCYSQNEPILSNPAQLQDFNDYIQSMSRWILLLIQHYIVHPSSYSLL